MKKRHFLLGFLALSLLLAVGISVYAKGSADGEVSVVTERSYFSDFEVKEQKVHLYCHVALRNDSGSEKTVQLTALFPADDKRLLTEREVSAMQGDKPQSFLVPGNATVEFDVDFVGDFAGTEIKQNRLLPEIRIIEVSE